MSTQETLSHLQARLNLTHQVIAVKSKEGNYEDVKRLMSYEEDIRKEMADILNKERENQLKLF